MELKNISSQKQKRSKLAKSKQKTQSLN